jgi:hypothetical protein
VRDTCRDQLACHVEESLARVSQSGLKIGGDVTTGGARGTIVEATSEAS